MGIAFGRDKDVAFKIGSKIELIAESIIRIILTLPGERLGLPEFGSNVRSFIFEQDIVEIQKLIQLELLAVLEKQEPRVRLTNITVTDIGADLRSFVLALEFVVKDNPEEPKLLFIPLTQ